jgi:hypothetical protein
MPTTPSPEDFPLDLRRALDRIDRKFHVFRRFRLAPDPVGS